MSYQHPSTPSQAEAFSEASWKEILAKAYLLPGNLVAVIGEGRNEIAARLTPLVRRIYVLDPETSAQSANQSSNKLEQLAYTGFPLPLPEESVDIVFASNFLNEHPIEALQELGRVLVPGGRLVILENFPPKPDQFRTWFQEADLVNLITRRLDASGQGMATGTRRIRMSDAVQEAYGNRVKQSTGCCGGSSSSQSCCSSDGYLPTQNMLFSTGYSSEEVSLVPTDAAEIALGCGNPTALANLVPGEVVLDIGSGGGMDAFLAAQKVGQSGRVIGVDMTPAMLGRARSTARKAGITNVEFRRGHAEQLPVEDHSVDVIFSNCVINLCEDKGQVFREAYRVLKPGGRLEVSDVVMDQSIPVELRLNHDEWAGCVSGALPETEYLDLIRETGFIQVSVVRTTSSGWLGKAQVYSALVSARKPAQSG